MKIYIDLVLSPVGLCSGITVSWLSICLFPVSSEILFSDKETVSGTIFSC